MGKFKLVTAANSPALLKCDTNSKCGSEDRISKLPDDVLLIILCLLKFKEAATTSVLSRRWVDLWKSVPLLNFYTIEALKRVSLDHSLSEMERAKYINWVNQVLVVHKCSAIEEFAVCFALSKVNKLDIDNWLKFAFARRVQRLVLDLSGCRLFIQKPEEIYAFPAQFCYVQPRTSSTFVDFKPLKQLFFDCVNVTGDTLEFFLSNCPFLESLQVYNSAGLVNLEVSGKYLRLRFLAISSTKNFECIKIFNTNLVKFHFGGNCDALFLHDLPFLVEVSIMGFQFVSDFFAKFSSCLGKLEILKLRFKDSNWSKELMNLPRLSGLKQLRLGFSSLVDGCVLECASLVCAFPYLQELLIDLWWISPNRSGREVSEIPYHPHKSLKLVMLAGYYGGSRDLELAMYFLKNAIALEELIIDPHNPLYNYSWSPKPAKVKEEEKTARTIAKQQLEGIELRPSIKLTIL